MKLLGDTPMPILATLIIVALCTISAYLLLVGLIGVLFMEPLAVPMLIMGGLLAHSLVINFPKSELNPED